MTTMGRTIGKPDLERLRVCFAKDGRLAHLGHIELLNTIMRSVRRAELPFSVGNGFARRMRIQFCQALPVGASSHAEYYDVYLRERVDLTWAASALRASTPPLLAPLDVTYADPREAALEAWLTRADWQVELVWAEDALRDGDARQVTGRLDASLHELAEQGSIDFMRGTQPRTLSLSDTLVSWRTSAAQTDEGRPCTQLELQTRSSNQGALRPAVLLEAALATPPLEDSRLCSQRVIRIAQWHEDEQGALIDPMAGT